MISLLFSRDPSWDKLFNCLFFYNSNWRLKIRCHPEPVEGESIGKWLRQAQPDITHVILMSNWYNIIDSYFNNKKAPDYLITGRLWF